MANVNSARGYVSLPAQSITGTTETPLLVPASSAGYSVLPSPSMPANGPLFVNVAPDAQNYSSTGAGTYVNDSVDGRQFRVRLVGLANISASTTLNVNLYYGQSSTLTSDTKVAAVTSAALTPAGTYSFILEGNFLWDSTSQKLNGFFWSDVNNIYTAAAATTQVTSVSATSLAFIPSFTFATGNAGNTIKLTEFLVESV